MGSTRPLPTTFSRRWPFRVLPALAVAGLAWLVAWETASFVPQLQASDAVRRTAALVCLTALVGLCIVMVGVALPQRLEVSATGVRLVARGRSWTLPWADVMGVGVARDAESGQSGLVKFRPAPGTRLPHLAHFSAYPRWEAGRGIVTLVPARGWAASDEDLIDTLRAHAGARWRD